MHRCSHEKGLARVQGDGERVGLGCLSGGGGTSPRSSTTPRQHAVDHNEHCQTAHTRHATTHTHPHRPDAAPVDADLVKLVEHIGSRTHREEAQGRASQVARTVTRTLDSVLVDPSGSANALVDRQRASSPQGPPPRLGPASLVTRQQALQARRREGQEEEDEPAGHPAACAGGLRAWQARDFAERDHFGGGRLRPVRRVCGDGTGQVAWCAHCRGQEGQGERRPPPPPLLLREANSCPRALPPVCAYIEPLVPAVDLRHPVRRPEQDGARLVRRSRTRHAACVYRAASPRTPAAALLPSHPAFVGCPRPFSPREELLGEWSRAAGEAADAERVDRSREGRGARWDASTVSRVSFSRVSLVPNGADSALASSGYHAVAA